MFTLHNLCTLDIIPVAHAGFQLSRIVATNVRVPHVPWCVSSPLVLQYNENAT
jgi:hypothetical protein